MRYVGVLNEHISLILSSQTYTGNAIFDYPKKESKKMNQESMKIVVVLNRKYPTPTLINAAGHALFGLSQLTNTNLKMREFRDVEQTYLSYLTDFPIIVLTAKNTNHLREFHTMAAQKGLPVNAFFPCMTIGTPEEQEIILQSKNINEIDYIAVASFGNQIVLDPLTKRFSLMREGDINSSMDQ
jgi:hypothetical protein